MTYTEKVQAWNSYISSKGINKAYGQFPSFLGMKLEKEPAPLMFSSYAKIAFYLGANFGLPWGLAMYLFSWRNSKMPAYLIAVGILLAGGLYGLTMAYFVLRQKAKMDVKSWESFNPVNVIA